MERLNYIEEYYRGIMDGTFIVGKYIWLLYEYLMKGLDDGSFFYDFDKADHAVEWMEKHCFHVEGPLAPGRLKLELWQKALLAAIFGIVDKYVSVALNDLGEVILAHFPSINRIFIVPLEKGLKALDDLLTVVLIIVRILFRKLVSRNIHKKVGLAPAKINIKENSGNIALDILEGLKDVVIEISADNSVIS